MIVFSPGLLDSPTFRFTTVLISTSGSAAVVSISTSSSFVAVKTPPDVIPIIVALASMLEVYTMLERMSLVHSCPRCVDAAYT